MPRKPILDVFLYGVMVWRSVLLVSAAEHHGQVKFGGLPVPGATVTAMQAGKTFSAITDSLGTYSFPDLPDGAWTVQIEMLGFAPLRQEVQVSSRAPDSEWNLKMLPLSEMRAATAPAQAPAASPGANAAEPAKGKARNAKNVPPAPTNTPTAFQRADLNATSPNASAPASDAATSGRVCRRGTISRESGRSAASRDAAA